MRYKPIDVFDTSKWDGPADAAEIKKLPGMSVRPDHSSKVDLTFAPDLGRMTESGAMYNPGDDESQGQILFKDEKGMDDSALAHELSHALDNLTKKREGDPDKAMNDWGPSSFPDQEGSHIYGRNDKSEEFAALMEARRTLAKNGVMRHPALGGDFDANVDKLLNAMVTEYPKYSRYKDPITIAKKALADPKYKDVLKGWLRNYGSDSNLQYSTKTKGFELA